MITFIKGKYSGFCFGVKRAIDEAEKLQGDRNFVLGEIIHNELVNEKLRKNGLKIIDNLTAEDIKEGDTLLIRTHGEPQSTFKTAEKMGLNVIDCTCPFVKDIHEKVRKHFAEGYKIVIIGNADHPEVKGINGWCENTALITENPDEINAIDSKKVCIVVQTTYSEEKFDKIIKKITIYTSKIVDIFNTICYTTTKRQREAEELSQKCDAMLIIGGAKSNNTRELYEICYKNCKNCFKITDPNPDIFDYSRLKDYSRIGVVFGASTPIEQFMEVISNMENTTEEIVVTETEEQVAKEVKNDVETVVSEPETPVVSEEVKETVDEKPAETVAEEKEEVKPEKPAPKSDMEHAFNNIKPNRDFRVGQIVTATISSVSDDGLTLSLKDTKKDDFELSKDELLNSYTKEDVNKSIRVMVIGKNPLKFSEKAMEKVLKEEADVEEIKNGKIFEVVIDATNQGGLIGKYGSYQVFVPASQIKLGFVKDLEKYVGKTLRLKAEKVEARGPRRQIVGSQRTILAEEREEREAIRAQKEAEFFENVQEGDVVLGTPVRFASFGAFIDVNGFDCLAHISDLSWTGCNDCSEVLEIGKQTEFKILKIDQEKKRVSVGYKQLQQKPWATILDRHQVGDVIHGKVVRIVSFGAFVEVEKGIDGLVHVSQISNKWLENPLSALQVGQEVDAKILGIDVEKERINLSIKALLAEEEVASAEEKKSDKKKRNDTSDEVELREWKEDKNDGVSIAEMINTDNQ